MIKITKFIDDNGKCLFDVWLNGLRDSRAKAQILVRINRLRLGNEGLWRAVGNGVRELKVSTGKGYRVYYGWTGKEVVLLLCGGEKSTQDKDIQTALKIWSDYNG